MDDGEFNLSNTIGIGLNIGEQMLLPVSNGEEEAAQLALQQQQHQQQQHQQHHHLEHEQQHQQQQHQQQQQHHLQQPLHEHTHYPTSNLNMEQHQPIAGINSGTAETTNVTCLDNTIGNFYPEPNPNLADLNAKLVETTQILECSSTDKTNEIEPILPKESPEKTIVEELGSITTNDKILENDKEVSENTKETGEKEVEDKDKGEDNDGNGDDDVDEEEDVDDVEEETEVEDAEVEEVDEEEVEEVEENEDDAGEAIIPDEVIVPENIKDKTTEETKTDKEDKESNKDGKDNEGEAEEEEANENEDSQDNEDENCDGPGISIRARRQEEQVDENQCRVCCTKENLVSIFKKVEDKIVADMLMTLCPSVSIVIKDFLPQYICNTCCDNVVIAIKLKNQCETTEKELRKKLSRHKNKIRRPVGYVVIDAPLDSDPPTDEEQANDEEFKVSDIASATPSEDSESDSESDSKRKKSRGRKRRKSAVVTPTDSRKSKNHSSDEEEDEDGDPIKNKRKRSSNSSPENFACNECDQTFSRKQSLVLHKRQHVYDRGEPIKCEVCGKKFKIRGAYRTHLEKHKDEKRPNKCTQCPRRFSSSNDLKRHIAEQHREKKMILPSCSKCSRTFSSSSRLQRHKEHGCHAVDSSKAKKHDGHSFGVGTDLFKAVAPLQTTYWSDSFSD